MKDKELKFQDVKVPHFLVTEEFTLKFYYEQQINREIQGIHVCGY